MTPSHVQPTTRRTPPTPHAGLIRTPAQRRALASPVKQELVDALEAAGPCTVASLASLLGRPADGLYFHLRSLLRVGLVVEAGSRPAGRRPAAAYDLVARPLKLDYDVPVGGRREITRVVAAALRLSQREFARACVGGQAVWGPERLIRGGRAKGWLTPAETTRCAALIDELTVLIRAGRPRAGARPMSLGFVLAPCPMPRSRG